MSSLRSEDGLPLYRRLADTLRDQIASGHYHVGAQLPAEEALGTMFGVSRITVRAALDQLADEGLVRRERGRGNFVSAPPVEQELIRLTDFVEDMAAAGLRATSRIIALREEAAPSAVAAHLLLAPGTQVVRLDRLRLANDTPIAFDTTWLPLRYGRLLDRDLLATETIYHQLETYYAIPVLSGTFLIEAGEATEELAEHLGIRPGGAVFVIHRTSFTDHHAPVYYQVRSYLASRVRFRMELNRTTADGRSRLLEFVPDFAQRP